MTAPDPAPPVGATVVIATRDRREGLRRVLEALAAQRGDRAFDVVVVDDGSAPPVGAADLAALPGARLLRGAGRGPAQARNAGLRATAAPVVLFTDDDTLPDPGWVDAALAFLDAEPGAVGVEGPIASLPYDRVHELSLESPGPGAYFTANVAYRRAVLEAIGGFDPTFPYPHCEDLDLAFRAQEHGEIGFAPDMRMGHVPRAASMREMVRRGRYSASEMHLLHRHPDRYGRAARLPGPVFATSNAARYWLGQMRAEGPGLLRRPGRALRLAAVAVGYVATTAATTVAIAARARLPGGGRTADR
jgi:GT2 family glycosyltransferase